MKCAYDIYENGYQNGVCFGYIPDFCHDDMQIWGMGYMDAKNGHHKTVDELQLVTESDTRLYKE